MKLVDYLDRTTGRWYKVSLPDDVPDAEAAFGNVIGPPELEGLDLPENVVTTLHNWLFNMGLFTARDVAGRRADVVSAIQRSLGLHVEAVIELYGQAETPIVATMDLKPRPEPKPIDTTNKRRRNH